MFPNFEVMSNEELINKIEELKGEFNNLTGDENWSVGYFIWTKLVAAERELNIRKGL